MDGGGDRGASSVGWPPLGRSRPVEDARISDVPVASAGDVHCPVISRWEESPPDRRAHHIRPPCPHALTSHRPGPQEPHSAETADT